MTSKTTGMIYRAVGLLADRLVFFSLYTPIASSKNGWTLTLKFCPHLTLDLISSITSPPLPSRNKSGLVNRVLASTDLLLTTFRHSAQDLISSGTCCRWAIQHVM